MLKHIILILLFLSISCTKEPKQKLRPTFSSISRNVFIKKCSLYTCHSSAFADKSGKLDLSGKDSYNNLINIPSKAYPEINRITPGKPDESLLLQRLEGKIIVSIPLERDCVTKEEIDIIREWIKKGAVQ
ncbi:MAG: hypothetical protein PHX78_08215 [bacterium]|nr:hypothetical protein [bacterium]